MEVIAVAYYAELEEEEGPLSELPEEIEVLVIEEEEVPMAEIESVIPKTGDASALWMILSVLSGSGAAGLCLRARKREEIDA